MFFERSPYILIFFKLVNCAFVVAVLTYIYKRYVLPAVKNIMRKECEDKQRFHDERQVLIKQANDLEAMIEQERMQSAILVEKVQQWQAVIEQNFQNNAFVQAARKEADYARRVQQETNIQFDRTYAWIMNQAITKAQDYFEQDAIAEKEDRLFMGRIISFMRNNAR